MLSYKIKAASLLCAAFLTLTACTAAEQSGPSVDAAADIAAETGAAPTSSAEETDAAESDETTEVSEEISVTESETAETDAVSEETEPPLTEETTAVDETVSEAAPTLPWTETPLSGILYINTDGVYSRAEAIQGSAKVYRYSVNDTVSVIARTDTDYFKLEDGSFIHVSYLSENKVEITQPPVTAASETTAAPETVSSAEETQTAAESPAVSETTAEEAAAASEESGNNSTWGQYGQRENTQTELDFIARTFELVNEERAQEGLPAYQHLDVLDTVSSIRAWELTVEYRSDHIRPDGTSCTTAFNQNGIFYGAWGENVAAGQTTPEEVVAAWMNSPPHRSAILSADYTYMGVGYYYSENDSQNYYHFWTQAFYRY
ncbi:MAG: CAP domain-containing protein [Bacteroides sp.]|nr:CAP domain-containing protein [Bacteroides sp.]